MKLEHMSLILGLTKSELKKRLDMGLLDPQILINYSSETTNLMSFKNQGGLFNGGVCWWHSRFQRNIFYLSIFRPDLNKPLKSETIDGFLVLLKDIFYYYLLPRNCELSKESFLKL